MTSEETYVCTDFGTSLRRMCFELATYYADDRAGHGKSLFDGLRSILPNRGHLITLSAIYVATVAFRLGDVESRCGQTLKLQLRSNPTDQYIEPMMITWNPKAVPTLARPYIQA